MNQAFAGGLGWDWGDQDGSEDGSPPLSKYLLPGQLVNKDFIMSLNIRSLNAGNKVDALRDLLSRQKNCRILCL